MSRVVNGGLQVSDAARRAVEAAVAEMGRAHQAARSLAGSRSESVALVVSEPSVRSSPIHFFAGTTLGVTGELAETRYQLVLLMLASDADHARIEHHLLRGGTDGALVVSARAGDPLVPAGRGQACLRGGGRTPAC